MFIVSKKQAAFAMITGGKRGINPEHILCTKVEE